jgi:ribokinase
MDRPTVLVVGSANVDLVTTVARCPKAGETLIGTSFKTVAGGKGANQAVAAARLGAHTFFAGCVGNDAFGEMQRSTLSEAGVDTTHLKTHPSEPTGTAIIFVADTGQNSIVVVPSANYGITPADVRALRPLFEKLDCVLLQLEIPLETVEATLDLAREAKVLSILDAGPAQRVPAEIIHKADIISPNETEAEAMTGLSVQSLDDAHSVAERLREMGARDVVLKLGENGCLYVGEECVHAPAFTVATVDTTAAGDAFTAALGCVWMRLPRREALRYANAAGALATTVAGAQPSMPTAAAVEAFLRERSSEFNRPGAIC